MADADFNSAVELKRLLAPGDNVELVAMLADGKNMGSLGNLAGWIAHTVPPELRPYHQLILEDGTILEHDDIEALVATPEYAVWKAEQT
jgi:hypothetical protein